MLYDPSAVKNRISVDSKQLALARKHDPLKLSNESKKEIKMLFETKNSESPSLGAVTNFIHSEINYNFRHAYEGLRNADGVWKARLGHCIEQNLLLRTVIPELIPELKQKTKLMIVKNPYGYGGSLKDLGIHLFVLAPSKNNLVARADAVAGDVLVAKKNEIKDSGVCSEYLNHREFSAFCMQDAGEDLGLIHKKYDEALDCLDIARQIDPNNYTIQITKGDVFFNMEEFEKAEKAYKQAIKIAPNLSDVHSNLGNFYSVLGEYKSATKAYLNAIQRETRDTEITEDTIKNHTKLVGRISSGKF